ncbi:MAG TPA: hypothetical protein DCX07_09860 [Phycisphaerales bacterium]|nr:hypothetical protein [Phycisphaerales bacterium]
MDAYWITMLFLLGACVGSFLNVVVWRLPRGESIVFPASHCPACGRAIRWYDNIPLVSWFVLRGRCRDCKVRISPRYVIVEALTAVLVAGLYAGFYVLRVRRGTGEFLHTWPMFAAHAALLCGLLACALVDIEKWIVPLEVCWFVSLVGVAAGAASPPAKELLPLVSPATGAMGLAAVVGLGVSLLLTRYGVLTPSFVDATDAPLSEDPEPARRIAGKKKSRRDKDQPAPPAVAITKAHGVNPRREVLREVLFLAPAFALAIGAYLLVTRVGWVADRWHAWNSQAAAGPFARHFAALQAAVWGYLVGGLWIWGTRILGTLAFGKEAMGMGDVHILAAVGAVCGWVVPSIAFFVAPFFALLWAVVLVLRRNQRELPYGPWLAVATLVVVVFYDYFAANLQPMFRTLELLREGNLP